MKVQKRNGTTQELDIAHIRKQTIPACEGLTNVSYEELELGAKIMFTDGITTKKIQEALIRSAESKIALDAPDWMYVAARLRLYDLYHRIKHYYGHTGADKDGDVYDKVDLYTVINKNDDIYTRSITSLYTKDSIDELNKEIKSERDKLLTTAAVQTLVSRYLGVRGSDTFELPQHMFMLIAMFVASDEESEEKRVHWSKIYYEELSSLRMIAATPINSNGRFKDSSTASCFLASFPDNLEGIFDGYKEVARASKAGGGLGIDISRMRALGSRIRHRDNAAGGVIPFTKILNDIALAVDQGGVRAGAFATYLECWHIDFPDFLDLCKRQGEDRRRAQDLFLAASIPDIFIKRIKESGMWTLFDPRDVPELTETYGDEFTAKYEEAERNFIQGIGKWNPNTKQIPVKELLGKMIYNWSTEGKLFWFFKDTVNRAHEHKDLGIIRSSNLCVEITQPTDENHTAVCNLGSLNLGQLKTIEEMVQTSKILTRFLDSIVSVTDYPTLNSRETQLARRSIGIGVIGEAEWLAQNHIMYGSDEHEHSIIDIYGNVSKAIEDTSKELAKEKGSCIIDGIRNAYRMAIAPNTSSGLLAGSTCSCEPIYAREWAENSKLGTYKMVAPHVTVDNLKYYPNAYELDQGRLLELTALRQKYVDMSISHSVYIDPTNYMNTGKPVSARDIARLILKAHELGVKTLYYFRAKARKNTNLEATEKPKISCVGCEN